MLQGLRRTLVAVAATAALVLIQSSGATASYTPYQGNCPANAGCLSAIDRATYNTTSVAADIYGWVISNSGYINLYNFGFVSTQPGCANALVDNCSSSVRNRMSGTQRSVCLYQGQNIAASTLWGYEPYSSTIYWSSQMPNNVMSSLYFEVFGTLCYGWTP
jgi:hypothetical protein